MEIKPHIAVLNTLVSLLEKISPELFSKPCDFLFGATIGQHFRHIIEFYQCCLSDPSLANYDLRKRNPLLETEPSFGVETLKDVLEKLRQAQAAENIPSSIQFTSSEEQSANFISIETSFFRELNYCLDHCIHHQALIKVGLKELGRLDLVDENFGVAFSTQRYKQQCAS